jgi:hypothetical protein
LIAIDIIEEAEAMGSDSRKDDANALAKEVKPSFEEEGMVVVRLATDIPRLVAKKMGKSVDFRVPWKEQFRKWSISECAKASIPKKLECCA